MPVFSDFLKLISARYKEHQLLNPFLLFKLGIKRVAQAVTHEIEGEHDDANGNGRQKQLIWIGAQRFRGVVAHGAKRSHGRRDADADKAHERLHKDSAGNQHGDSD